MIVMIINVFYIAVLIHHPKSELYHVWEKSNEQVIDHYTENISADTGSYANMPKGDTLRTVGYPAVLQFFMLFTNGLVFLFLFNCLLGVFLFYITYDMIGKWAWVMMALGSFTLYVPMLYTDLLFATLFVTSVWLIRKNVWLHILFLGLASLVRPSLAWFFLIEPLVLYLNGYKGRILLTAFAVAFVVTSFNPIRNYVNHGIWTHSTVLDFNINSGYYYGGAESKPMYFVDAFKANFLSGHYDFAGAMFGVYKRDYGDKRGSVVMYWSNIICVLLNVLIWSRFAIRVLQNRVNWGNVLIVAYFVVPTLFGAAGARLRLPIEFLLFI
jgi:hypothetical protein